MLLDVLQVLIEQDAKYVAPKGVRTTIKRGILLSEGKAPPLLNSISHRLVAGQAVSKKTLSRLYNLLEQLEKEVTAQATSKKNLWLMLGGIRGKKWMEQVLA